MKKFTLFSIIALMLCFSAFSVILPAEDVGESLSIDSLYEVDASVTQLESVEVIQFITVDINPIDSEKTINSHTANYLFITYYIHATESTHVGVIGNEKRFRHILYMSGNRDIRDIV